MKRYGTLGRISSISGYVGETAGTLAIGAGVWKIAGGATMDIYAKTIAGKLHFAYGTGVISQHAYGVQKGSMHISIKYAAEFAAKARSLTDIPILHAGKVLAPEGTPAYSCVSAALNSYVRSGGAMLGGTSVVTTAAGWPIICTYLPDWLDEEEEED
jgi:hypothetical protein